MAQVRIYGDMRSQPVRMVMDFCKMAKLPYEYQNVDLFKGEHKAPEYVAKFPQNAVPAMEDLRPEAEGFTLVESNTIVKYLANTFEIPDHLYPKEPRARANIDAFLDGLHTGLRNFVKLIVPKVLLKLFAPPEVVEARNDPKVIQPIEEDIFKHVKNLETLYLGNEKR